MQDAAAAALKDSTRERLCEQQRSSGIVSLVMFQHERRQQQRCSLSPGRPQPRKQMEEGREEGKETEREQLMRGRDV